MSVRIVKRKQKRRPKNRAYMSPILREDIDECSRLVVLIEEVFIVGEVVGIHSWFVEFEVFRNRFGVGTILLTTDDDREVR